MIRQSPGRSLDGMGAGFRHCARRGLCQNVDDQPIAQAHGSQMGARLKPEYRAVGDTLHAHQSGRPMARQIQWAVSGQHQPVFVPPDRLQMGGDRSTKIKDHAHEARVPSRPDRYRADRFRAMRRST
ncbi:MAG: hypothetical protein KGL12_02215 [Rhodospirillales bacterium]|nr:hypothetical protein [Rhodospirillales bacterium]